MGQMYKITVCRKKVLSWICSFIICKLKSNSCFFILGHDTQIVPKRRATYQSTATDYLPCKFWKQSVCLGKKSFLSISIFHVDFFAFWEYYPPEVKWLAKSRAFTFSNGKELFFLNTKNSVSLLAQDYFPCFSKLRRIPG